MAAGTLKVKHLMKLKICPVFLVVLVLTFSTAFADDWPHWRGPARDGIVQESSGYSGGKWALKSLWKKPFGLGGSSPIVIGKSVYCLGWKNGLDTLYCVDLASGKTNWKQSYKSPKYGRLSKGDKGIYSGPSSTPEYDSQTGLLYSLGTDGDLHCWDTKRKGKRTWSVNLHDILDIKVRKRIGRSAWRDYGFTTAPLVMGNKVLVEAGAMEGNVVAFDKATGKLAWTSQCKDQAGHTGGLVPITVERVPCVAVLTLNHLLVLRTDGANEGKTVAKYKWTTTFANNIATPAVFKNFVVITSAYNQGAICKLRITLKGAEKVWKASYSSKVCSPLIVGGKVYFAWRQLRCLDLQSGKQLWSGGKFGDAGSCIVTSDGRIIVWGGRGRLVLAETALRSPTKYRELARRDRLARNDVWPHVVLSSGHLLCRDRLGAMQCFRLLNSAE